MRFTPGQIEFFKRRAELLARMHQAASSQEHYDRAVNAYLRMHNNGVNKFEAMEFVLHKMQSGEFK
jgi:hypothetical protein